MRMAGIGLKLKKPKSLKDFSTIKAYGYAIATNLGPVLISILLQFIILSVAVDAGVSMNDRRVYTSVVSYMVITAALVSGGFSSLISRYLSECLFTKSFHKILPIFKGSTVFELMILLPFYIVWVLFCNISLSNTMFSIFLFAAMLIIFNAINFLAAAKANTLVLGSFAAGLIVGGVLAVVLLRLFKIEAVVAMMLSTFVAYGVVMVLCVWFVYGIYPESDSSAFDFLRYLQTHKKALMTGAMTNIGLFGHIIVMWFLHTQRRLVQGLIYEVTLYDVPALFAFFTIFISVSNFFVLAERDFYPEYQSYLHVLGEEGSIKDISIAENGMLSGLHKQLSYAMIKQLVFTVFAITAGGMFLRKLGIGFSENMISVFQLLCIAYALYSIANMFVTIMLYFSDETGALTAIVLFAVASIICSVVSVYLPFYLTGIGFVAGCAVYYVAAATRLSHVSSHLQYFVLGKQPVVAQGSQGFFVRLGDKLDEFFDKSNEKRNELG